MTDRTQHGDLERSVTLALSELPIEFDVMHWTSDDSAVVKIGHRGFEAIYQLAWLPRPSLTAVSQLNRTDTTDRLLVVGPRITSRAADALRAAEIDYLDYAGNAHLGFGPVLIDIRGRHAPRTDTVDRTTDANLFSTRRMQVLFVLLVWPDIAGMPVRTIAESAGTSVGITQSTLDIMKKADYLTEARGLRRRDALIDLWAAAFRNSLRPKILERNFIGDIRNWSPPPDYLMSGESAVRTIRQPQSLTVYVEQFDIVNAIENGWRKSDDPNIEIRRKFWKEPSGMPSHNQSTAFFRSSAPPLLVYADLLASSEPRQSEVARNLRRDRLV